MSSCWFCALGDHSSDLAAVGTCRQCFTSVCPRHGALDAESRRFVCLPCIADDLARPSRSSAAGRAARVAPILGLRHGDDLIRRLPEVAARAARFVRPLHAVMPMVGPMAMRRILRLSGRPLVVPDRRRAAWAVAISLAAMSNAEADDDVILRTDPADASPAWRRSPWAMGVLYSTHLPGFSETLSAYGLSVPPGDVLDDEITDGLPVVRPDTIGKVMFMRYWPLVDELVKLELETARYVARTVYGEQADIELLGDVDAARLMEEANELVGDDGSDAGRDPGDDETITLDD